MGIGDKILEYLYLKKRDPNAPTGGGIRFMNGVNRISLIMFIFALIVIIVKSIFFRHH